MKTRNGCQLFIMLMIALASALADASETPSIVLTTDIMSTTNPTAGALRATGYYRYFYHNDDSKLWKNLYYQGGVQFSANPAFLQAGVHIEWMPITLIQLRFQYDYFKHLGAFGSLIDFDTPDSSYGDDVLSARKGSELTGATQRFSFHPTLRAKLGDFVINNNVDYYFYKISADRPYFLERGIDILVARNGQIFTDRLMLLYQAKLPWVEQTLVGPTYEYTKSKETNLERQRLGISIIQSIKPSSLPFNNIRWLVQAAYNVRDRNRQDTIFLALGASAEFEI